MNGTMADGVWPGGSFNSVGNNSGGLGRTAPVILAIAFDNQCNLWVVDYGNNRIRYDKPPRLRRRNDLTGSATPVPTAPVLTTAPGTGVLVFNGGIGTNFGVQINFGTILAAGNTTVAHGSDGPPPPPGHQVLGFSHHGSLGDLYPNASPAYYDVSTTASLSGLHTICMTYDPSQGRRGCTPISCITRPVDD
jgi:hypothetical protein